VEVDPAVPEAASLISALDSDLNDRYPGMPIHGIEPVEVRHNGGVFLIGKLDGVGVACGAIRPLSDSVGELKRMFVRKEQRGHGFGRAMLATLERIATQRGYQTIRLETGTNQPEAIRLYEDAGYRRIPCFAEYVSDPRSRCFEKSLSRAACNQTQSGW
jgi:GNAT superfamily N-acetyltransferase